MIRLKIGVSGSNGDAHEYDDGTGFSSTNTLAKFTSHTSSGSRYNAGFHYNSVAIPVGAKIHAAWVELGGWYGITDRDVNCRVYCEDADNAVHFGTTADVTSRTTTTAYVEWVQSTGWPQHYSGVISLKTPDISACVQEVVDRGGWSSGNDIVVLLKGNSDTFNEAEVYTQDEGAGWISPLRILYTASGDIASHEVLMY